MPKTSGYTLLEVMISMFLLSIAMLGMDVMAVQSLHENRKIYYLSVAINEIEAMSERLQALGNADGLTEQITRWKQEINNLLPQSQGQVTGSFPDYEITLFWNQSTCQKITNGCLKTSVHVV
ncbi:MAG: prepilin-type N-terminal cleavage/methylation domain-containing protein [Pseudomonadota bacterium]